MKTLVNRTCDAEGAGATGVVVGVAFSSFFESGAPGTASTATRWGANTPVDCRNGVGRWVGLEMTKQ